MSAPASEIAPEDVLTLQEAGVSSVRALLARYGMELIESIPGAEIPGSYWGEREAGLIGKQVFARRDTPLHSVLHESCHFICMDPVRRASLDRDAGGDYDEENAVCYLQILLGGELPGCSCARMCLDMDRWGYTFRLGSAQRWFDTDAADARDWLIACGIVDAAERLTWCRRE